MDNTWNNVLLVFNALLWSITFLLYQRKKKRFGVGSGILLLYTCVSVIGIHVYNSPYASRMFNDLTIFPFIYLYVMINIVLFPIMYIESKKVIKIKHPTSLLFNVVVIIIIILSLYDIVDVFYNLSSGVILLFVDESYGREAYQNILDKTQYSSDSSIDVLGVMSNVAKGISPPFMLYYLVLEKKNKCLFIGLVISSLVMPLYAISVGSRWILAIFLFNMLFGYLFINKFMSNKNKNRMRVFALSFGILLLVPFYLVTYSRSLGDFKKSMFSIERYISEGFIRFNNYGLDAGGCRNGDYTTVLFKEFLTLKPAKTYIDRVDRYSKMKINESVFYTYVGDFTLDYGPIFAFVIFLFTSFVYLIVFQVKNNCMSFCQYLMFYLLMVGCLGYYQFPLGRIDGNLQLIALLILSIIFKIDDFFYGRKYR